MAQLSGVRLALPDTGLNSRTLSAIFMFLYMAVLTASRSGGDTVCQQPGISMNTDNPPEVCRSSIDNHMSRRSLLNTPIGARSKTTTERLDYFGGEIRTLHTEVLELGTCPYNGQS